jgi:malate dehydrogenase (oxaloacetate-decarboxylating)
MAHVSPSFSATLRLKLEDAPGTFARVAEAIGEAGGSLGAIDIVRVERRHKIRDVTVSASDDAHLHRIAEAVRSVDGVEVVRISDRTFLMHLGGKIEIASKIPLKTRDDLSMAYTPGVARVSQAVADDPSAAWNLTSKQNTVAVVSDGTAVLGLGDIGPEAAMPVMEGKALLFKEFGGVDAWPICLATKDPDEIVTVCKAIAPGFGGINLEDISAPRCFEIEARLREELDIPVFHDDQHGTAIVALAALRNALRVVKKDLRDVRIVMSGAGAAGTAILKLFLKAGASNVVVADFNGVLYPEREDIASGEHPALMWSATHTNASGMRGTLKEALVGADVFVGVSAPHILTGDDIATMNDDAIVFAMANPEPEVDPVDAAQHATVVATGRSDFANQINNVLCFPGLFRGLLDAHSTGVTEEMVVAAAKAIAGIVTEKELSREYIIPSVFNREVAPAVANAVKAVVAEQGLAR